MGPGRLGGAGTERPTVARAGDLGRDDPPDREDDQSTDCVENVVIRGDDDDDQRDDRVREREHLADSRFHARHKCEGAPRCPADVHARHRRELVGDLGRAARVERPERGILLQCVDKAVVRSRYRVQEARRHQRIELEADERERGRDRECVPEPRVVIAELSIQVDPREDRHDEVEGAVEVIRPDDQRSEVQRPLLERLLVKHADVVLDRDDLLGVRVRGRWMCAVEVPHERVDEVERENSKNLEPPVEDVAVAQDAAASQPRPLSRFDLAAHACVLSTSTERLWWPTAKAGAPRTLTNNVHTYQRRPAATARLSGKPCAERNEWRKSTSAPSRTAKPASEIGSTCSIRTAGANASTPNTGTGICSARKMSPYMSTMES